MKSLSRVRLFVTPCTVAHQASPSMEFSRQEYWSGLPFSSPVGKEATCSAGDPGSIPGLGRSPGEGKGSPLQYSGLENSMDYIVRRVAKSRT